MVTTYGVSHVLIDEPITVSHAQSITQAVRPMSQTDKSIGASLASMMLTGVMTAMNTMLADVTHV